MEQWTQDQAIEFECAREAIIHLMALHSAEIAIEYQKPSHSQPRVALLGAGRGALAEELGRLHVTDTEAVVKARTKYEAVVRAWLAGHIEAHAIDGAPLLRL